MYVVTRGSPSGSSPPASAFAFGVCVNNPVNGFCMLETLFAIVENGFGNFESGFDVGRYVNGLLIIVVSVVGSVSVSVEDDLSPRPYRKYANAAIEKAIIASKMYSPVMELLLDSFTEPELFVGGPEDVDLPTHRYAPGSPVVVVVEGSHTVLLFFIVLNSFL